MNMPGFTAEASLCKTRGHYQTDRHAINLRTQMISAIYPARERIETYGCPPGTSMWGNPYAGEEWGCTPDDWHPDFGGGPGGGGPSGGPKGGPPGDGGDPPPEPAKTPPKPTFHVCEESEYNSGHDAPWWTKAVADCQKDNGTLECKTVVTPGDPDVRCCHRVYIGGMGSAKTCYKLTAPTAHL